MDNEVKNLLEQNPVLKPMVNNDFLIIPFNQVIAINTNNDDEDVIRLHIDILKIKGEK